MQKFTKFIYKVLNSTKFFIASLCLFATHGIWIALSAASLPFDEYYHLGIIKFYSHQWSPFISHQPTSMSFVGDITRLPSYLYHYLMSFPYRFLELFIHNEYWLTVSMRFINIAIVVGGIILFRKLFLKIGISRRIIHLGSLIFMMLPIVVLFAASSNYDNLMFLLTPIFLMFGLNLIKGKFTLKNIVGFISLGLITCLVKNEFLVLFGLASIATIYLIIKNYGYKDFIKKLKVNIKRAKLLNVLILSLILLASVGLFAERYGYNFIKYHSVNVPCQDVQSFEVCKHYSPWNRNHISKNDKPSIPLYSNIVSYSQHWVTIMMRGFVPNFANVPKFAIQSDPYGNYEFARPLPLMFGLVYAGLMLTLLSLAFNAKAIWKIKWLRIFLIVSATYIVVLWLFNYRGYLKTGRAYAIQPRYLLPILIPLIVACLKIISFGIKKPSQRVSLSLLVVVILIYSGGAFGWFIRSNQYWYWQNQTIINANQNIQKVLQKTIIN